MNTMRTMIVRDQDVALARALAEAVAQQPGMWPCGLSAAPEGPTTHWMASGDMRIEFASLMPLDEVTQDEEGNTVITRVAPGQPAQLVALAVMADPPFETTIAAVTTLLDHAQITDGTMDCWAAASVKGLVKTAEPLDDRGSLWP